MSNDLDLYQKLKTEVAQVPWSALASHHERNAVFLVDHEVDLVNMGVEIALDNVTFVKQHLEDGLLVNPLPEEVKAWETDETNYTFDMIIVQPYVLIQKRSF